MKHALAQHLGIQQLRSAQHLALNQPRACKYLDQRTLGPAKLQPVGLLPDPHLRRLHALFASIYEAIVTFIRGANKAGRGRSVFSDSPCT